MAQAILVNAVPYTVAVVPGNGTLQVPSIVIVDVAGFIKNDPSVYGLKPTGITPFAQDSANNQVSLALSGTKVAISWDAVSAQLTGVTTVPLVLYFSPFVTI